MQLCCDYVFGHTWNNRATEWRKKTDCNIISFPCSWVRRGYDSLERRKRPKTWCTRYLNDAETERQDAAADEKLKKQLSVRDVE